MTGSERKCRTEETYFNSHPHKEDDRRKEGRRKMTEHFNSHPHKEDDGSVTPMIVSSFHFNSHPHKEDDGTEIPLGMMQDAFQLTSSQGG